MSAAAKNINWYRLAFIIFVAGYVLLMLVSTRLAPTDDYVFIHTIQNGKPLLYYFSPPPGYDNLTKMGRLAIFGDIEYNFPLLFSKSPSPFWYYFIHAIQYIILMVLFVKILGKFTSNKFLIYITPVLLSLFPGMAIALFRTHIAERNLIFYYAIFIYFFLRYIEKPKLHYLIFGLIGANMAIHIKENAFIALGAFALSYLLLSWKNSLPKTDGPQAQKPGVKIFAGLVFLGCLVYLLLYYFIVYKHLEPGAVLAGQVPYNHLLVFAKLFLNYGLFSDPILILLLLPLTAWRIYKALRRQLELHPVYDSMLIAGSMYVAGYLALNMFSPSHLFPAYVFALPPLIYFFSPIRSSTMSSDSSANESEYACGFNSSTKDVSLKTSNGVNQREQRTFFFKGATVVVGIALLFNVFPTGIHYLTYYKYLSVNFNKTLDFMVKDIGSRYPRQRANVFLDAIDPIGGFPTYFVFTEFFQYKGLAWQKFDFKSDVKTDYNIPQHSKDFLSNFPFSIFQKNNFFEISKGDYLVISPDSTTKNIDKTYIQSLSKDYQLLFKTKSPLALPNFNLKTLAKYILTKKLSQGRGKEGLIINENLIQSPDYYVFIKK